MDRNIEVIDYTLSRTDSEGVNTNLPFSTNFKETKSINQANVVIAAYVNKNYKDNFAILNSITGINQAIIQINQDLSNLTDIVDLQDETIDSLNTLVNNLNSSVSNINLALDDINSNISDIESMLTDVDNDILQIKIDILTNASDITNLKNITKTLYLTNVNSAGQFKVNITNVLTAGDIFNFKFPSYSGGTSGNVTISIDDGVTYKTLLVNDVVIDYFIVEDRYINVIYDGTNFISFNQDVRLDTLENTVSGILLNGVIGSTQYGGTVSSNLNNIIKSGFYTCYSGTTGLSTEMNSLAVSFHVLHQNSNVGVAGAYQRAVAYVNTEIIVFERTKISNTWGNWVKTVSRTEYDKLVNYSTTEQVIGKWINGKPIYRKVVDFGLLPNINTKNVPHNISNLGVVLNLSGYATDNTNYFLLPRVHRDNSLVIILEASTTNILINTGYNFSSYNGVVVIDYTKTTD